MRRFHISLLALLAMVLLMIQPAWAAPDAASVFRRVWERQDKPVDERVADPWG
jgi:hypothetical protein